MMTRIISGFAGSLALTVPPRETRPTTDRVREALFSSLEARNAITNATVLDLYAGSGALGLEAMSRGATNVILVEKSARAAAICRTNARTIQRAAPQTLQPTVTVVQQSTQSFLDSTTLTFDLVLIDPPYELDENELAHNLHTIAARIHPNSDIIVERRSRSPEPQWPAALLRNRKTKYGETTLWWAHLAQPGTQGS